MLTWSRRRNSATRARPWSGRVTVETPLCTSAGIATPACQWWTSVLLWRYDASLLLLLYPGAFWTFCPVPVMENFPLLKTLSRCLGRHLPLWFTGKKHCLCYSAACWLTVVLHSRVRMCCAFCINLFNLISLLCFQNQLSGNLLRKFKNSNGWQKLWVVFTNFSLFFYKSHQVRCAGRTAVMFLVEAG